MILDISRVHAQLVRNQQEAPAFEDGARKGTKPDLDLVLMMMLVEATRQVALETQLTRKAATTIANDMRILLHDSTVGRQELIGKLDPSIFEFASSLANPTTETE